MDFRRRLMKLTNGVYIVERCDKELRFIIADDKAMLFEKDKKNHRVTLKKHIENMLTLPYYRNVKKIKDT